MLAIIFFHVQVSGVFRLVQVVEASLMTVEGVFSHSCNFLDPEVPQCSVFRLPVSDTGRFQALLLCSHHRQELFRSDVKKT